MVLFIDLSTANVENLTLIQTAPTFQDVEQTLETDDYRVAIGKS